MNIVVPQGLLCSVTIPLAGLEELGTHTRSSLVVILPLRPASVSALSMVTTAILRLVVLSMESGAMV